jgi:hypothetical protein
MEKARFRKNNYISFVQSKRMKEDLMLASKLLREMTEVYDKFTSIDRIMMLLN